MSNSEDLNYEAGHEHLLTVRVTDSGDLYADATITIKLIDENEAPSVSAELLPSFSATVRELASSGTAVAQVSGVDPDEASAKSAWSDLWYAFEGGSDTAGGESADLFRIGLSTGEITVNTAGRLDYERDGAQQT